MQATQSQMLRGRSMNPKANALRWKLLCPPEFREPYVWWRIKMIGYTNYRGAPIPKLKADRETVVAFRNHAKDLINKYANKKRLPCGHMSREVHCMVCPELAIKSFYEVCKRKGVTADDLRAKLKARQDEQKRTHRPDRIP